VLLRIALPEATKIQQCARWAGVFRADGSGFGNALQCFSYVNGK
jgi:hypothetical protein